MFRKRGSHVLCFSVIWTNGLLSIIYHWSILIKSISEKETRRKVQQNSTFSSSSVIFSFAKIDGKSDILSYQDTVNEIIRKCLYERKYRTDYLKLLVIKATKTLVIELRFTLTLRIIPTKLMSRALRKMSYQVAGIIENIHRKTDQGFFKASKHRTSYSSCRKTYMFTTTSFVWLSCGNILYFWIKVVVTRTFKTWL